MNVKGSQSNKSTAGKNNHLSHSRKSKIIDEKKEFDINERMKDDLMRP